MAFSLDELEKALPIHLKGAINQDILDILNKSISDPIFAEHVRDNMIGYVDILKDGKFKLADYVSACIYVSYKLGGKSDKEAWAATFPDRYQALISKGTTSSAIAAHVAMYNKGKLVNLIYEQTLIPTWVLNQDIRQKAINHTLLLMLNAKREDVQQKAAETLIRELKPPETGKLQIDIGVGANTEITDMKSMMKQLIESQQASIRAGHSTQEIAHQKLVTVIDHEENDDD